MASIAPKSANGQNARASMANSAVLEKKGVGSVRRSTPDSEALASSDDDHDQNNLMSSLHSVKSLPSGPPRRPSWMTEVQASTTKQRKFSLGGISHTSSGSQPTTPSGENGPWDGPGNGARPGTSGSTTYPWNAQQWTKDRPSRLMEVTRSPSGSFHDDLRSPTSNAGLPFEIPLEPSRKTVRSQSYSAGQLEKLPGFENMTPNTGYGRGKPGLAHRPSRPSMLGDGARDTLSSLREDEDDVESSASSSDRGYKNMANTARVGAGRGYGTMPRASATSPQPNGAFRFGPRSTTFPLSPESDYAVADENEENGDNSYELVHAMAQAVVSSNASSATNLASIATTIENRRLEGLKRSQWQSSLGFGVVEEGTQSRRHSFADLPTRTRNNSMNINPDLMQLNQYNGYNTSIASPLGQSETFQRGPVAEERKSNHFTTPSSLSQQLYAMLVQMQHEEENGLIRAQTDDKNFAASYFSGIASHSRQIREPATEDYNPFAVPNVFSRPVRILYLVAFKCNRADIYYVPENTGLQVKAGDTVIVEGDRGQDLGTVEHGNIQMEQAKQLKEEYTQKHFRCLMMFSRMYPHIAAIAGDDAAFNGAVNGNQPNPGPSGANAATTAAANFSREAASQFEPEPRPKMIKRVARPDEVHLLREKEGNEAKAKRVCQTKVNEHGLRMEILDAEFQHDYRKLTFFYYAEEYINFNELVTDLFKVYKTRIWMSAINPASYTVMNPNNIVRPQHWPRPGPTTNAAAYLRAQEEYRTTLESGRTTSPIDRDGPAARGNREYERLVQMANSSRTNPYPANAQAHSNGPAADEYPASAPHYDPRRQNVPFTPPAAQYAAFAHQYTPNGPAQGAWPSAAAPMSSPYPYPYPDARDLHNYSVAPTGATHAGGLNQQAAAFTPRATNSAHFAGNHGYPSNGGDALMEQFQRLALQARQA